MIPEGHPKPRSASGGMGVRGLKTIVWNAALVGFAVMTEHGPPRNVLDSRFRENDMPLKYNRRKRRRPAERLSRIVLTLACKG